MALGSSGLLGRIRPAHNCRSSLAGYGTPSAALTPCASCTPGPPSTFTVVRVGLVAGGQGFDGVHLRAPGREGVGLPCWLPVVFGPRGGGCEPAPDPAGIVRAHRSGFTGSVGGTLRSATREKRPQLVFLPVGARQGM
jgi:hypothetical protein